MKKIGYFIIVVLSFIIVSCEKDLQLNEMQTNNVAGEWMVKACVNGTKIYEPFAIKTYNASSAKDSVSINDNAGNFWNFQVKAAIDFTNESFQTRNSVNAIPGYNIGVKIMNGRVIDNDSIYLEIQFEDDVTPYGTTYQLAGHRTK